MKYRKKLGSGTGDDVPARFIDPLRLPTKQQRQATGFIERLEQLPRYHWSSGMTTKDAPEGPHWFASPTGEMVKWADVQAALRGSDR